MSKCHNCRYYSRLEDDYWCSLNNFAIGPNAEACRHYRTRQGYAEEDIVEESDEQQEEVPLAKDEGDIVVTSREIEEVRRRRMSKV